MKNIKVGEYQNPENVIIENAILLFKNFSGREDKYNRNGRRTFNVIIPNEQHALMLLEEGWNIKEIPKRDDDDTISYRVQVDVSFRELPYIKPCKVFMYAGKNRVQLDDQTISELDYADIKNVDLVIRPREWWNDAGEYNIKAYLQEMHVVIDTSVFDDKYASYEYQE